MPSLRNLARCALVALAFHGLIACQGDDPDDRDRQQCLAVVDHLVNLEPASRDPIDPRRAAVIEEQRRNLRDAIEEREMADCMSRSRAHARCVLAATTPSAVIDCNK